MLLRQLRNRRRRIPGPHGSDEEPGERKKEMIIKILGKDIEIPEKPREKINEATCQKCGGRRWITRTDPNGYEFAEPCDCQKREWAFNRLRLSGLETIAKKYTFETYWIGNEEQARIKETAQKYAKNLQGWFFIGGQTGSGKTHICTAITVAAIEAGQDARYIRWRTTSEELKEAKKDGGYKEKVGQIKRAGVLYIDDLWKGQPTEADIKLAFEILSERYDERLPTIISSERSIAEIVKIDESIASRIVERCGRDRLLAIRKNPRANFRTKTAEQKNVEKVAE